MISSDRRRSDRNENSIKINSFYWRVTINWAWLDILPLFRIFVWRGFFINHAVDIVSFISVVNQHFMSAPYPLPTIFYLSLIMVFSAFFLPHAFYLLWHTFNLSTENSLIIIIEYCEYVPDDWCRNICMMEDNIFYALHNNNNNSCWYFLEVFQ